MNDFKLESRQIYQSKIKTLNVSKVKQDQEEILNCINILNFVGLINM